MDDNAGQKLPSQDLDKAKGEIEEMLKSSPASPQTAISKFVDNLIEEKGFTAISDEVRKEIKIDLETRLDDFMAARVISALSDTDVAAFEEMLKAQKPDEEVQKFVSEHIPDFVSFLTNVLLEFRNVYLGIIQAPRIIEEEKPLESSQTIN